MNPLQFVRRLMRERFKHCECGRALSEWFVRYDQRRNKTVMYCYGGCGQLSPYESHRDEDSPK